MSDEAVPQQFSYDRQDPGFWAYEFDRYVSAEMTATRVGRHEEALDAADEVRRAAARVQTTIVGNARRAGTSRLAIGRPAALTKQAAWTRWKGVESAGPTLAGLGAHLVVVVTIGMRHVDDDNPEHGLDLAAYLPYSWAWVDAVARDSRIEPLLEEW
ncbi:hypothetical protein ITP53_37895 [Nonomuraea sp. K274]|uniref:Uncharacterized protein n=1 Tax=Nonomuraea cypriaca TaxID=1187855 RepID=A0A931F384_9ACTN|nr:hypothetical protein [Nonomuraea cypriaca]MBF8191377.1 hypothetical protein [Nonomuraea cypriaca]